MTYRDIPNLVRDSLKREGAYDFGLGVVLRAPKDASGTGGSASYRVEFRVEPVLPGKALAKRRERYARELDKAYALAAEVFDEMRDRASGTYVEYDTDRLFGDVVERWFASPHPRWGESYPKKVRSLLDNWVVHDQITITRRGRNHPVVLATIPIGGLTADDYNQALEHVRRERAYRTYTEIHGLVVQILKWAVANRYLRPADATVHHQMPLAVPTGDEESSPGVVRMIPDEEIPSASMIVALAATAGERFGPRQQMLIYVLAYTGMRISEALALRNDDRFVFDADHGIWRIHVHEQLHKTERRTLLPKWRKKRWAFVPAWMSDEVTEFLDDTAAGGWLFPSPGRKIRRPDGVVERRDAGAFPYDHWYHRVWDLAAEYTPGWPERDDWWPVEAGPLPRGKQDQRRWLWPAHTLRHHAATYLLSELGLDPEDVASFLGHRSGRQVWEMYVRVRPDLYGRAAAASRNAGDPRAL